MACTVSVRIKNDEKVLKKDFLIYEAFVASDEDPIVRNCIEEVLKEFGDEPDDISVTIKIEVV